MKFPKEMEACPKCNLPIKRILAIKDENGKWHADYDCQLRCHEEIKVYRNN